MSATVGQTAPDFTLDDQDGRPVRLADLQGRWVVVYFYPKDDTPGCTAESCSFRDSFEDFTDAGATVVGISSDSVESHKAFAAKLLDDRNRAWIPQLEKSMSGKSVFIAVGAGHLGGKSGVIRLLTAKGYKLKPIRL